LGSDTIEGTGKAAYIALSVDKTTKLFCDKVMSNKAGATPQWSRQFRRSGQFPENISRPWQWIRRRNVPDSRRCPMTLGRLFICPSLYSWKWREYTHGLIWQYLPQRTPSKGSDKDNSTGLLKKLIAVFARF
jgi:hypothetical protein